MQSRCLLRVLFALLALILSKGQDVMGSGLSCLRLSPAGDGLTRVTFLRVDAAGVRFLYLTVWSEDTRLVTCEVQSSPLVTESYRALCDSSGWQSQQPTRRFNISALLAQDAPCALGSSSAPKLTRLTRRDGTVGKTRRKRSWIFPGTLWCGTGSTAVQYEQLGMFESADRCCREHDHCLHTIPAFSMNYGVFNTKFYTVSHCDCDQRFRQCLLHVNDTISSMVGYSFFSVLQVPCFVLKQPTQCTDTHWWGMCKGGKEAPYAVFKSPLPYNSSDITSKYEHKADSNKLSNTEGQHVTESPPISPHTKSPTSKNKCRSEDPLRGGTLHRRKQKGEGCKKHRKLHSAEPSQIPSTSRARNNTPSVVTSLSRASKSSTLMSNKKRAGKKKSRKGLLAHPTQRSQVPPQTTANFYPQTTPPTPPHVLTAITAVTSTTQSSKKVPKHTRCCGFRTLLRGDTFLPHCKNCPAQNTTSHGTDVTPSTATYGSPSKATTLETPRLDKTRATPRQDTQTTADSAVSASTKLMTEAPIHEGRRPQTQMVSHLPWITMQQEPVGRTKAPVTQSERGLKLLHNLTDVQPLCRSLKHLDECKYKIPPLAKKYGLHNVESKTAYHCDCTSRLAVHIKSFKQRSILPTLMADFVSQYCFNLPKEKECRSRKSCSGGFIKASDLLQALKKIEERNTAGMRKRGNPVRLYKRCLRLEREADIMAHLT
uniref:group 3 secretory phospholipase A2-like n=1 Tax=Scatophagus argus TaxID=75038 RepID=UPI001ED8194C|nr:group 3 secretory phospholipase A2-like [Scatophagus argus]